MRFTRLSAPLIALASLAPLAACSAVVSPDPTRLGGQDAGRIDLMRDAFVPEGTDARVVDPLPDAFVPPGVDAPSRPDAFVPPSCTDGPPRCEGSVLVRCASGVETREDCAARGAFVCEAGSCEPRTCTPGSVSCSRDGTGVVTCNESGTSLGYERCPMGCDAATSMCRGTTTVCPDFPAVGVGDSHRIDLCTLRDSTSPIAGDGCGGSTADGGDATFSLTVATATTVTIDLRDIDMRAGVDTVVYLRRACDDAGSQIDCSDDIPCDESDVMIGCSGGVQVRQSRFTVDLEPGTYYLVVDAYIYDAFTCGQVELRVTSG